MTLFLIGIVCGIALSLFFSFGPAFFSQIQASVHYGFRNAVPFAFGVGTSDLMMVSLLLLVSDHIPASDLMQMLGSRWLIYVGAAVVTAFGLYSMFLKTRRAAECSDNDHIDFLNVSVPSRLSIYFRGLSLNFFNPVLWLYWATLVTFVILGDTDFLLWQRYVFFGGVLLSTVSLDVLKCKLASLLQNIITYRFLSVFNKCVGVILIVFAVVMVASTIPRFEKETNQRPAKMMQEIMNTRIVDKGVDK